VAAVKVLITGSMGFLGSHFVERLIRDGHDVDHIDIEAPSPKDARLWFRYGGQRFDLVIHCAAVSPHRAAIDGDAVTVGAGNLALDAALFDWAARTRPGRVVYFSSSAAYPTYLQTGEFGELEESVLREHPGEPDAIYGWVKLTGERLADAYRQAGGKVTVVRPFSGYGADQSADFPFGAFRDRALAREDPFIIWGTGEQVRDWVHVSDVVGATLAAVEQGVDGPLNVCTGVGTSLRELAEMFCAQAGYRPAFQTRPDAPSGVAYRVGDPTRLREVYEPRVSLAEGVKRALEAGP
jgi:nucleoside-diphosphate-sugar epimerase